MAVPGYVVRQIPHHLFWRRLLKALEPHQWKICADQRYGTKSRFAPQVMVGKSKVNGRRMVAVCHVAVAEQSRIRSLFEEEIERQLTAAGALQQGEESVSLSQQTTEYGPAESLDIAAPRRYFVIDKSYGIIDAHFFAHDGQLIMSISYLQ